MPFGSYAQRLALGIPRASFPASGFAFHGLRYSPIRASRLRLPSGSGSDHGQSGLTKSVGGTNVGGFLQTALANNKGELVVPVKVTGTLQHPSFTPDAQSLAKMKLNNLLPTTGDPTKGIVGALFGGGKPGSGGDVVGGILNGLNGQKSRTSEGQNPQKPEDLVNGILGQFGKKKKE